MVVAFVLCLVFSCVCVCVCVFVLVLDTSTYLASGFIEIVYKLYLMGIAFKDYKNVSWRLEMYALLLGCKKINYGWMLYLILCKLKWVVLHSYQRNTTRLLSVSNGLGQVNPPY